MNRLQLWTRVRKKSVLAHWLYGVLCAIVALQFFPACLALLVVFGVMEWWNDWAENAREGCSDWWDAFLVFCIGFGVILFLDLLGKVNIRWI